MEKSKGFISEFKEFIMRGNVIDMAVGVIIGGAFQVIVSSLVEDIFMPVIQMFTGKSALEDLSVKIGSAQIKYGNFLSAVVNFLLMALIIFIFIKVINSFRRKPEEVEEKTTKICEFCFEEIPIQAKRCPCCTSILVKEDEKQK